MAIRSAFYIDGFNLYHAINDLREPFLKWCNLWKLAELVIPQKSEQVCKVVFCTAYYPRDERKKFRHIQYINALNIAKVETVLGHYTHEPQGCKGCGANWEKPTEKQTDINVALSLYHDAFSDAFDKAYLITADSDQAATARFMSLNFPNRPLVTVAPPGRKPSSHIEKFADQRITLSRDHIERCLFPSIVVRDGFDAARRPKEYDPPHWWVPPDARPKKK